MLANIPLTEVAAIGGGLITAVAGAIGAFAGIRWQKARSTLALAQATEAVAEAELTKAQTYTEYITAIGNLWDTVTKARQAAEAAETRAAGAQLTANEMREALAVAKALVEENDRRWLAAEQILRECADGVPHLRQSILALQISLTNGAQPVTPLPHVDGDEALERATAEAEAAKAKTKTRKRGHKGRGRKI